MKMFVVDYKYDNEPVRTKLFDFKTEQEAAQEFCAKVRANRGVVNIKIRSK